MSSQSFPVPDAVLMRSSSIGKNALQTKEDVPIIESSVWRKFDWRILPVAFIFHLLAFLDRSNIANARIAGLQTDLNISDYQYTLALTVTYIPFIAAELPANLLLKYVGPDRMLPLMVTLWGITCTLQGLIHDYRGLLVSRFFLGLFEAGLYPGLVLYLSGFYPRRFLQSRITIVFLSATLSGAFSGLLAAGIMNMDQIQGRPGWSWIFILDGILTSTFGLMSLSFIPRSPSEAQFLTEEEQIYVIDRLRNDGVLSYDSDGDRFSWLEVVTAFTSLQMYLIAVISFMSGTLLYAHAYFEPTIVEGLGHHSPIQVQLLSVPPYFAAFIINLGSALISDKFGARGFIMIFFSLMTLTSFTAYLVTSSESVKYGSLFFSLSGSYGFIPTLSAWTANNVAPHARRATAIAIATAMANSGGILSTWLVGILSPNHNYSAATVLFIIFSAGILVASTTNLLFLGLQNQKKEEIRAKSERRDEQEGLGDRSAWYIYSL